MAIYQMTITIVGDARNEDDFRQDIADQLSESELDWRTETMPEPVEDWPAWSDHAARRQAPQGWVRSINEVLDTAENLVTESMLRTVDIHTREVEVELVPAPLPVEVELPPSPLGLFNQEHEGHALYPYAAGSDEEVQVYLGPIDYHHAVVIAWQVVPGRHIAQLQWGCRRIDGEDEARCHWRWSHAYQAVISTVSKEARPHALTLIQWVADLCKLNNWEWK